MRPKDFSTLKNIIFSPFILHLPSHLSVKKLLFQYSQFYLFQSIFTVELKQSEAYSSILLSHNNMRLSFFYIFLQTCSIFFYGLIFHFLVYIILQFFNLPFVGQFTCFRVFSIIETMPNVFVQVVEWICFVNMFG